jgi:Holliday junction resolvase RusA-like endonuclease
MRLVVKGQLADLNKHDQANRNNKFGGAALKKEQTDLVAWQLKGKPKITRPCTLEFVWYYSGRFDFDNIRFACKYVLDGMVKAGILPNDNQKWVLGFDGDTFIKVPKGQEKVEIFVSEYDATTM